jgi:hypothetical protein
MQLHLRTLLIVGAIAPPTIKWLWDVRAEWVPFVPLVLPVALFGFVTILYVTAMAIDADAERL